MCVSPTGRPISALMGFPTTAFAPSALLAATATVAAQISASAVFLFIFIFRTHFPAFISSSFVAKERAIE